jgi:hypothetical protein
VLAVPWTLRSLDRLALIRCLCHARSSARLAPSRHRTSIASIIPLA